MILNVVIALILVAIDQVSKWIVLKEMEIGQTIPVIDKFFHITHVHNRGVAFGMMYGQVSIVSVIGVLAVVGLILYIHKKNEEFSWFSRTGFVLILGGAIGNLIDRTLRGFVVDFIDFRGIWPYIFNVADVYINIGVVLILIEYILENEREKKKNSVEADKTEN